MQSFATFITTCKNLTEASDQAIHTDHTKLNGMMIRKGYLSVGPVGGATAVYHHMNTGDVVTHTHDPQSIAHDAWTVREHQPKHIFKDNYSASGKGLKSLLTHLDHFHQARRH
jgi:hypothetical protein